ncbi:hypothetical protein QYF36_015011 [Acer negundo]|nr:hypothetical protein QYF36_015011 [Acer negundo]
MPLTRNFVCICKWLCSCCAYIDCGGLSGVYGRSDQSRREVSLATKKGLVTTSDDHNSDAMLLSVPSSSFHFSPRQTTGSYSLLTNGSPGVLSRQVEKRVQISSPPQPRAFSFRASLACSSASYAADFTSTGTGRFPLAQRHFWLKGLLSWLLSKMYLIDALKVFDRTQGKSKKKGAFRSPLAWGVLSLTEQLPSQPSLLKRFSSLGACSPIGNFIPLYEGLWLYQSKEVGLLNGGSAPSVGYYCDLAQCSSSSDSTPETPKGRQDLTIRLGKNIGPPYQLARPHVVRFFPSELGKGSYDITLSSTPPH